MRMQLSIRGRWTDEAKHSLRQYKGEWVSPEDFPDNFLPAPCENADQLRAFQLHSFFWYVGQGWIDRESVQATIRTVDDGECRPPYPTLRDIATAFCKHVDTSSGVAMEALQEYSKLFHRALEGGKR